MKLPNAMASGWWGAPGPREIPGWCVTEIYVGDTLVEHANELVLPRLRELVG
jgi:hypothetical protein